MSALLNLGSLIFGIIAWILPVFNLMQYNKARHGRWAILSAVSLSACAVSLCMQIFEVNHRVKIQDWSALMDTSHAMASAATVLLVVTMILNAITLAVYCGKNPKD